MMLEQNGLGMRLLEALVFAVVTTGLLVGTRALRRGRRRPRNRKTGSPEG